MGTLHDQFLRNPQYGLAHFASALAQFSPDVILAEALPGFPAIEGAIDGGIEQAVVLAFAEEAGVSVVPVDWFDDEFIRAADAEFQGITPALKEVVEPLYEEYKNAFSTRPLLEMNGSEWLGKIRKIYALLEENGLVMSRKRNERICRNLAGALAALRGKRVLVLFGLDHKFFLDDCVKGIPAQKLIQPAEWYSDAAVGQSGAGGSLWERSVANLEAARDLLVARLENGHYSRDIAERLKKKLPRFDAWIAAIRKRP
ncbi:MAG: hypothetical protein HUU37_06620 [Bdellovibrionales bacterium]|nr:hypothetical protein [Bdellovibrionales bacterium]